VEQAAKRTLMRAVLRGTVGCTFAVMGALAPVHASPLTFFGEDLNNTCCSVPNVDDPARLSTLPNSTAAQTAFLANLVGVSTQDFEGFADGASPNTLTFGSDTATLFGSPAVKRVETGTYNGTYPISGNQFLLQQVAPSNTFEITFSNPQAAFGFFATDIGDGGAQLILTFTNAGGGTETIAVSNLANGSSNSGSALYFGIIDTQNPFTKVTFTNTNSTQDGFGFDDMTIGRLEQVVTKVPEPGTLALLGIGLVGLAAGRRRKH